MARKRNPDARYRALERAGAAGDVDALLNLAREKVRVGEEDNVFLERAEALHQELPNIPNYYDPKGTIIAGELAKRIALLQSYVLRSSNEVIRRTPSRYTFRDILDLITIESAMDSSEVASGEFTDYSYALVSMEGGAKEAYGYNDSSMSDEVENYFGVAPEALTRGEVDFLWDKVGAIVYFANDGSRDLEYFETSEALEATWLTIQAQFYEVENEIEDDTLTLDGEDLDA